MIITEKFIRDNVTNGYKGFAIGITTAQLECLGETRTKGWLYRLVGKEITEEQAAKFIAIGKANRNKKSIPDSTPENSKPKQRSTGKEWYDLYPQIISKGEKFFDEVVKDLRDIINSSGN